MEKSTQNSDKPDNPDLKNDIPQISDQEIDKETDSENFSVVGVGASAGGLEALETFFKNMPPNINCSFVVVQHLSPDYKSLMLELLSKHTSMEIFRVKDGMKLKPHCIYLIPPKKNMTIFHRKLYLNEQNHQQGLNLPIDIFFRSLAEDLAERSIGVVLSGTGSDGSLGVRAIKGAGGMVMVQDENSAKFDGMPKSAISTGLVDYILPPEKMGAQLVNYIKHPYVSRTESSRNLAVRHEDAYSKILSLIRSESGTDFTYYKPNTIIRRIERRMSINQIDNIEEYVDYLMQSSSEIGTLYKEILIGVTKFFRDTEVFEVVKESIIPRIFTENSERKVIRVWDVGCSTGEEAYSLAIMFREHMDKINSYYDIKIFATDIDRDSIEYASAGVYPASILTDVSEEHIKKYFTKKNDMFQVSETIRQMVIFATHNIIKDPPFSKINMISCRNLLIYLKPSLQKKVLSAFRFSLVSGGYLLLGTSESVGEMETHFDTINSKHKIYRCKEGGRPPEINDLTSPMLSNSVRQIATSRQERSARQSHKAELIDKIEKKLYTDFVPSALLVDQSYEVVHIFKDANKFVRLPSGRIVYNIMKMIHPDLSIALGTALHKVLKEKEEISYSNLVVNHNDNKILLDMFVRPIEMDEKNKMHALVVLDEKPVPDPKTLEYDNFDMDAKSEQRINDLEQELQYTRENLQATIEELETSNEELQATNEELIASNEELQSTNEELQSVNEELYTVNSEYQKKIDELTELNNDISNWMANTYAGTIFLDLDLRIRKFTPGVTETINLIENDVGRPIKHISHNLDYDKFIPDIEYVLETLNHLQKEVRNNHGKWYLMKIVPYRTLENAVKGVVVTFIDITEIKSYEEQLERKHNLMIRILESSPVGKTMVDSSGNIMFANKRAEEILGLEKDKITSRTYNDPEWKSTDMEGNPIPDEKRIFNLIMKDKKTIYDYKEKIKWPDGRIVPISVNGAPMFDENGRPIGAVFSIDTLSRKKLRETE
ncbi:MAG: chemotaxis protein CheB [Candidatus Kapaibacterium sp.]